MVQGDMSLEPDERGEYLVMDDSLGLIEDEIRASFTPEQRAKIVALEIKQLGHAIPRDENFKPLYP